MRNERGNILFLILLAVALFAALNYAVSQSMQGGTKNASSENADVAAAEILQWFAAVDNAVMRMKLGGIAYEDMSFGYNGTRMDGTIANNVLNNSRCNSTTCYVFKSTGGGVAPPDFLHFYIENPTGWATNHLRSGLYGQMVKWPGKGTDLNDLALYIEGIRPDICRAINSRLGVDAMASSQPSGPWLDITNSTNWDQSAATLTNMSLMQSYETFAKPSYAGSGAGEYCIVWHVVIKR